jgi:hypothetical protein
MFVQLKHQYNEDIEAMAIRQKALEGENDDLREQLQACLDEVILLHLDLESPYFLVTLLT